MIDLLSPLARFWKTKDVNIYDTVFKLHSKVTAMCVSVQPVGRTKTWFPSTGDGVLFGGLCDLPLR